MVIVFGDGLAKKAVVAGQTAMTETSVLENFMFLCELKPGDMM